MTRQQLYQNILAKQSYLCVGLDPDLDRLPKHLLSLEDPIFAFNKAIIDATRDLCVAYKPNLAFYEALGVKGWRAFEKTVEYIGENHFIIADAKRGDIGNTSKKYAQAFFEQNPCDALTIAPYMGSDSIEPFLEFKGKWVILLALTSNKGSQDFQFMQEGEELLHEKVLQTATKWGTPDNLMFVVGATHPEKFERIRSLVPEHFLLVPGVGAQGGDLKKVSKYGMNGQCGLLVNSSRGVIYASNGEDFAEKARTAAQKIQLEMQVILKEQI
ncbi:MAG: orotidine-5'-phosphate decarboxylase [Bacteroidota bacterium]